MFVAKKYNKGEKHPRSVWARYIGGSLGGTDFEVKTKAHSWAARYNIENHTKEWFEENSNKGGHTLSHDAWAVVWEDPEPTENEFGLVSP